LSSLRSNLIVIIIGIVAIISTFLSIIPFESLWGRDIGFGSSSVLIIAGIIAFFLLKILSVSGEKNLWRFMSLFVFWVIVSNIVSTVLFLIPQNAYSTILGPYSQYFDFIKAFPTFLQGNPLQSLIFNILGLLIISWSLVDVLLVQIRNIKLVIANIFALIVLVIFSALVLPSSGSQLITFFILFALFSVTWIVLAIQQKTPSLRIFALIIAISFISIGLARVIFNLVPGLPSNSYINLPLSSSLEIIQTSFLNKFTPVWRLITGWGASAFSYVFPSYRPLSVVQEFGTDLAFNKSTNFWTDILIEQGFAGLIAWAFLFGYAIYYFVKSLDKKGITKEFSLILFILFTSFISFIPSVVIFLIFILAAIYFDKVENQQSNLKNIQAVSLHISDYKGNVRNIIAHSLVVIGLVSLILVIPLAVQGIQIQYYQARAFQRISFAQTQIIKENYSIAATTYVDAYNEAIKGSTVCGDCSIFSYIKLNALYSIYVLNNTHSDKVGELKIDKRFLTNRLLNHSYSLVEKNPLRYDYWLLSANTFSSLASTEKSGPYADEALISYNTALSQNPYDLNTRYTFVDFLVQLGDDTQAIQILGQNITVLKQVAGSTLRVQFLEAGYFVKLKQFDQAKEKYESIKKGIDSTTLTEIEKENIRRFADEQVIQVGKLKTAFEQLPKVTLTPIPTQKP